MVRISEKDDDRSMAQYRKSSSTSSLIHPGHRSSLLPSHFEEASSHRKSQLSFFCCLNCIKNIRYLKMRNKPGHHLCLALFLLILLVAVFLISTSCLDSSCESAANNNNIVSSGSNNGHHQQNVPSMMSLKHVLRDFSGIPITSMSSSPFTGPVASGGNSYGNKMSFDQISSNSDLYFDIKQNDVIVFLHIQKTGGTKFGRHLVHDLILESPCQCKKGKKRCKCVRPKDAAKDYESDEDSSASSSFDTNSLKSNSDRYWLFSRYSMGWKCGLHADWTELTNCVDNAMDESEGITALGVPSRRRRYFYITLLRDPIARFISEWKHVQRGATWRSSRHWCSGRVPTDQELPSCYPGQADWRGVTLDEFLSCPSNLAINRQTRMLADLTLVGCYNRSVLSEEDRDTLLLASAKDNLRKMAYFGLCENQSMSQYLFEATFKLNFKSSFVQLNQTHSTFALNNLPKDVLDNIRKVNHLDVQLYDYAERLLKARFNHLAESDFNFGDNWKRVTSNGTEKEGIKDPNTGSSTDQGNHLSPINSDGPKSDGHKLLKPANVPVQQLHLISFKDDDYDQDTANYVDTDAKGVKQSEY